MVRCVDALHFAFLSLFSTPVLYYLAGSFVPLVTLRWFFLVPVCLTLPATAARYYFPLTYCVPTATFCNIRRLTHLYPHYYSISEALRAGRQRFAAFARTIAFHALLTSRLRSSLSLSPSYPSPFYLYLRSMKQTFTVAYAQKRRTFETLTSLCSLRLRATRTFCFYSSAYTSGLVCLPPQQPFAFGGWFNLHTRRACCYITPHLLPYPIPYTTTTFTPPTWFHSHTVCFITPPYLVFFCVLSSLICFRTSI